jgi:hypothetical protein
MMAAPVASPSRFRLNIEVSEMITWQRNNIQAADMLEAILSLPNFLRRASKAAAYWSGSTSANSELSWMRTGKPCPLFAQTLATVVGMAGRYHLVKEDDGELQKTSTRTCATACSMAVCHWAKAAA